MAVMKAKVPAALASGVICLLLGGGLGAVIMWAAAKNSSQQPNTGSGGDEEKNPKGLGSSGPPGGTGGKGGKGGKGGGRGPTAAMQLAQLVNKLDVLTEHSLHIALTPDQKKQVKELLADLSEKEAITEEEATAKRDALLKLLEPNRKTLEDAGYRWPGGGGPGGGGGAGGGGPPPANPFKEGEGAERLKSLQATLGK